MAHFALIKNGTVAEVIVISNDNCGGGVFPESEPIGQAFITSICLEGEWLQTSYSGLFRGAYAGIGFEYDEESDTFVAPEVPEP